MYIIIFFLLLLSEVLYLSFADHHKIFDKPNLRSSHLYSTIRGGGIVFYIGILIYYILNGIHYPFFSIGLTLIIIISFLEDIKTIPFITRIAFHFIAILLMFYDCGVYSLPFLIIVVFIIVSIGVINAYNFMDGINGMTGGYSLVVLSSFWYINNYIVPFIDNERIYFISISLLVFNLFNFRKRALCFAGDVGAIGIAYIIVFLLAKLIVQTSNFTYIIILLVYGVDSILTIVHRIILKENIFVAHREHLYQIMSNELHIPHICVSMVYMTIQMTIMIGYFAFQAYSVWYFFVSASLLATLYVLFMRKYFSLHLI